MVSQDLYLAAETPVGFVVSGIDNGGLYLWRPGEQPQLVLDAVDVGRADPTGVTILTFSRESDDLVIFDLEHERQTTIPRPPSAKWSRSAFSPDASWLAIDLDSRLSQRRRTSPHRCKTP